MLEGFWILQIENPQFTSGGVIMFVGGKAFGGDNGFTWIGTYDVRDSVVKARVNVHNFDPAIKSIMGVSGDYEMHFSGTMNGDSITGTAIIANRPQNSVGVRLTKRANL